MIVLVGRRGRAAREAHRVRVSHAAGPCNVPLVARFPGTQPHKNR